jgi:hypothetical protein
LRSFRVVDTAGDRLQVRTVSLLGIRGHVVIISRPGWCVLQCRFVVGGMAAVAEGAGTRIAIYRGIWAPAGRILPSRITERATRQTLARVREHFAERDAAVR